MGDDSGLLVLVVGWLVCVMLPFGLVVFVGFLWWWFVLTGLFARVGFFGLSLCCMVY